MDVHASLQTIEVLNAIYRRRAVRGYTAQPVLREEIDALILAAIQAPSAMNLQPWSFAVFTGADRLKAISDRAKAFQLADPRFPQETKALLGSLENIFYGAPVLIVICATSAHAQAAEDCCLAAQNLMLAALAEGFATCPIGFARPWLETEAAKNELRIPVELCPVFPLVVGYARGETPAHGRRPPRVLWM